MKSMMSRILSSECIHRHNFPADSVRMDFENGMILVGVDFDRTRDAKTKVFLYRNGTWKAYFVSDNYTREMWMYWKRFHKVSREMRHFNTQKAMDHDRRHKCGSGGVRLTPFCGQVTDYETRKEPFHDFRRVWN